MFVIKEACCIFLFGLFILTWKFGRMTKFNDLYIWNVPLQDLSGVMKVLIKSERRWSTPRQKLSSQLLVCCFLTNSSSFSFCFFWRLKALSWTCLNCLLKLFFSSPLNHFAIVYNLTCTSFSLPLISVPVNFRRETTDPGLRIRALRMYPMQLAIVPTLQSAPISLHHPERSGFHVNFRFLVSSSS